MEKLSLPMEEVPRGHSPEKKLEKKDKKLMADVITQSGLLVKETLKDFDRTREEHQKTIESAQNFLIMNERHSEEDWYRSFHSEIVEYETLLVRKIITYVSEAILESAWDPMKAKHMSKIHDEIMDRYIPMYKSYGMKEVADQLRAIAVAIELKLKTNK